MYGLVSWKQKEGWKEGREVGRTLRRKEMEEFDN